MHSTGTMRRHTRSSIHGLQKFYTKIEDRPQVREVVTTFKEHHPIEKVSHPVMHLLVAGQCMWCTAVVHSCWWLGNACGAQQSGPSDACSSQLQHCLVLSRAQHLRLPRGMLQSVAPLLCAWLGEVQASWLTDLWLRSCTLWSCQRQCFLCS